MADHDYSGFIDSKTHSANDGGFEPLWMPPAMFDFQEALTALALRKGRYALFEDCGLGKTLQEMTWAENVARHTGGRVLILAPLSVAAQFVSEGEKFGIEVERSREGEGAARVTVTNYERLHHFRAEDFAGVVCDESSILKSFDGATRAAITEFMRTRPYRLLGTATAAPNDYVELGTSSEALGQLGHMDMLGRFFKNERNNCSTRGAGGFAGKGAYEAMAWRFKGHAEDAFWRWVCSWARSLRRPSDLGFEDGKFVLPPLTENEHVVKARAPREGMLFSMPAIGLAEEREERRRTLVERCELAASLVRDTGQPAVMWCHLNDEGDLLQRLVPDSIQVSGKDSDDEKEAKFEAFTSGQARVMVTKPVLAAWGLNWQHCAHMVSFASHSFEQDYQSIRRMWRFGQTRPVVVDRVHSDGETRISANRARKAAQADSMFAELVRHMQQAQAIDGRRHFTTAEEVPSWL